MSEINRVKASLSTQILKTLKDIKKVSVQVPLGGIFSTAKGFRIKAELLAITRFKADIEDDFSSENYSHTRHYIYIKTETEASVLLFGKVKTLKTSAKVPLFEGIIIGETPGIITGK